MRIIAKYSPWVGDKIKTIMTEGIRRNTRKPVSKTNKRRKVSRRQAIAVAIDMARRSGHKTPSKSPWSA